MATYYCQQGAYGTYATTPTWGVAQEGDGTGTGIATPAIASIVVNAVAAAGNTVTIMGVTLTAVASGATAGQFNVGADVATQANNLASAINAATGTVPTGVSNSGHQLRSMVYARGPSGGAPAGTVQIMTRYGSAQANYATNANVIISSSGWSAAPTITQFAGGVGGVWGYLANDDTLTSIWPPAIAKFGYGCTFKGTANAPLSGNNMVWGDICYIRSNNTMLTFSRTGSVQWNWTTPGTFCVDNGTVWPGDTGYFKMRGYSSYSTNIGQASGNRFVLTSLDQSRFIIECNDSALGGGNFSLIIGATSQLGGLFHLDNVTLNDLGTSTGTITMGPSTQSFSGSETILTRAVMTVTRNAYYSFVTSPTSGNGHSVLIVEDCVLNWPYYTGTPSTGLVNSPSVVGTSASQLRIYLRDIKVNITNKPYLVVGTVTVNNTYGGCCLHAENISGVLPSATVGLFGQLTTPYGLEDTNYILQQGVGDSRQYKFEAGGFVEDWTPAGGIYPTYNCSFPDGTAWSKAITWAGSNFLNLARWRGSEIARFHPVAVTAGLQTITVDMLVDPLVAAAITTNHVSLYATYVSASTNALKKETTRTNLVSFTALPSSSAGWTIPSGAYSAFVPIKITLALSSAIKINSELDVSLRLHSVNPLASGATTTVFVNPDAALS